MRKTQIKKNIGYTLTYLQKLTTILAFYYKTKYQQVIYKIALNIEKRWRSFLQPLQNVKNINNDGLCTYHFFKDICDLYFNFK